MSTNKELEHLALAIFLQLIREESDPAMAPHLARKSFEIAAGFLSVADEY